MQGFLAKLGLTRSYVCLNAWAYALHPGERCAGARRGSTSRRSSTGATSSTTRATGPALEAVVAFGGMAQEAVDLWPGAPERRSS